MSTISILSFFGGILLLLYGMKLAGEGLQRSAGPYLKGILFTATSNRFRALGAGALITVLLQSSSATTVMLVGFVGAGLMSLGQTMGVILGADIGTTITVQVIAFKVYDYAIGLIGLGLFMMFLGKSGTLKDSGQVILGFGFVFYSLKILVETFEPATRDPFFGELLLSLGDDPVAGVIVSALLTAMLQSSAATLALAITAAHAGLLTIEGALPIVLGANVGTSATAILASIGAPTNAKRVALGHTLFKIIGVLIALPLLPYFITLVEGTSSDMARQVANGHTAFNIAIAVIFLPFIKPFTRIVELLMPLREQSKVFGPKYLDKVVLSTPSLALGQAAREALREADIVHDMLSRSIEVFKRQDTRLLESVVEREDDVDLLDREIKLYVTKLSKESLTDDEARREMEIFIFSDNMENIADVIEKNLMVMARKKIKGQLTFSKEGMEEIEELHKVVLQNFDMGVAAFANSDTGLAHKLLTHKERFGDDVAVMRDAHIDRLARGLKETVDTSAIHLDTLTNFKRINSYITNIAYPLLEREKKG